MNKAEGSHSRETSAHYVITVGGGGGKCGLCDSVGRGGAARQCWEGRGCGTVLGGEGLRDHLILGVRKGSSVVGSSEMRFDI